MTIHTDRLPPGLEDDVPGSIESLSETVSIDGSIPRVVVRRVLDNDRRRAIVRCLLGLEDAEPIPVRQLVARIADVEHDATAVTSLHDRRQRIHVSLCQTHLPLLENYRLLSYDRDDGLVAPGARLSAFESVLGDTRE
ncbi:hypothetical protein RBH26_15280 [Natronolimnohabitans sp. A-GB9]|uniref:DUF7344 domain-containing protein n=1 Tax=Natronolimnohabitans sp. A-GB9 TaxID=3069757 RepID=UPI0027B1D9AA|nr:hypothetical protein [Natronolimnohabitans sp. A-GB9]MDQ2051840.1 hypothetical protein [Natronolimnohabitans sp. A-GB9]